MTRRLGAVLFADAVGYTRLMGQDEEGTHRAVQGLLQDFRRLCTEHRGEILDVYGDGLFALFESAVEAVRCSIASQRAVAASNVDVVEQSRIEFRIGIHLGELRLDGGRPYGDCVNIASRLEGLATPGGICISASVHGQVKHELACGYECIGPKQLKNVETPVVVYRVCDDAGGVTMRPGVREDPQIRGARTKQGPAVPNVPSIAVLPFRNRGGDPEQDYFCDGITEDIITNLSRFHSLFVIARGSAFLYRDRASADELVGQELGVRYVASGSVRMSPTRLRMTVRLRDAESREILWAERYDRELSDVFAVQDEITETIVSAIATRVEAAESERLEAGLPLLLEAYGFVLKGQQRVFRYTREDNAAARSLYESALRATPGYARAIAAISRTLNLDWRYAWSSEAAREAALDRALELAREAIALDETDARGFGELGFVHLYRKEHDACIAAYERARELNPNDADLMSDMADALAHSGRSTEAVVLLHNAMRLNPHYPDQYLWHLAGVYYNLHRYEDAVNAAVRMHNPTEGARVLAASYAQLGRMGEARREAARVREAHPEFSLERWRAILPDRNPEETERYLEGLRKAGL